MRAPDFLIVGAAKSGTTSLSNYLDQHPNINIVSNRLEYFGEYSNEMMPALSQKEYIALFSSIPQTVMAGEKSVSYLYSQKAALQIKKMNPKMKILIILRNPVDRAYSDYWHRKRNSMETLSFEDALEAEEARIKQKAPFEQHYATYGLYAKKVERYFSLFGRDQCRVFLFDELVQNPQKVCAQCFDFLGVEPIEKNIDFRIYNKGGAPKNNIAAKTLSQLSRNIKVVKFVRSFIPEVLKKRVSQWMNKKSTGYAYPKMKTETRKKLTRFFEENMLRLQEILNRDLGNWLET